jgi:hypothetical protein
MYQRRMTEYPKDCPPNENIEEEWKLMLEILNKTANECLGTKSKIEKKKRLYSWNSEIKTAVQEKKQAYYYGFKTDFHNIMKITAIRQQK